jgi:hypothetical protein
MYALAIIRKVIANGGASFIGEAVAFNVCVSYKLIIGKIWVESNMQCDGVNPTIENDGLNSNIQNDV